MNSWIGKGVMLTRNLQTLVLGDVPEAQEINGSPCPVPEGPYALVEFSDTGRGIREELHDRIFEPFFTTRRTNRHVGLGLAMVRSVMEQCGGGITVESSPGHGARFDAPDLPFEARRRTDAPGDD